MAIILRSDSVITNPRPGTPALTIPTDITDEARLDWDARDLQVGEFSTWEDRRLGAEIGHRGPEGEGTLSIVDDYGPVGVRISLTSIGSEDYTLEGDVTKVIVFRPESGIGSNARLITSGADSYRTTQASGGHYILSSNNGSSSGYAEAPGEFGAVQAHAAAWEGGHTVRAIRDGGELLTETGTYPTRDTESIRIGGRTAGSQGQPEDTLTGVIHRILIFERALSGEDMRGLTTFLANEWA